jgi:hypothetical protein
MACEHDIPRSIKTTPNPCGRAAELENWQKVRFDLRDTRAHTGTASENWRYPTYYPSHDSFPGTPALADLSFVNLTDGSKVYLPCPRSQDPNVVTGDFIVYELDCEDNKYAVGGYQDACIGKIDLWSGTTANVRPGWIALEGATPPNIATRYGKFPTNAENKFILNKTTNVLATCDDTGVTVDVNIDGHAAVTTVEIDDHTGGSAVTESNIGITWNLETDYQYVDVDCDGDVNPDHAHSFEVTSGAVNIWGNANGVGTLYTALSTVQGGCTSEQKDDACNAEIDLTADIVCTTGYHNHDITGYIYLHDPGHAHDLEISPHVVTASTTIAPHEIEATATRKIPYVVTLLIMRYDNAANAVANTTLEAEVCGLDP